MKRVTIDLCEFDAMKVEISELKGRLHSAEVDLQIQTTNTCEPMYEVFIDPFFFNSPKITINDSFFTKQQLRVKHDENAVKAIDMVKDEITALLVKVERMDKLESLCVGQQKIINDFDKLWWWRLHKFFS